MAASSIRKEAPALIQAHRALLQSLEQTLQLPEQYTVSIRNASDALVDREVSRVLEAIPVEELNREKRGIRVKTLRDLGYENLAQIHHASVQELADINGISDQGAVDIKQFTAQLASQTRDGVKIKLSLDDQSPAATGLVRAISQALRCQRPVQTCKQLLQQRADVNQAIADLEPSKSGLRWLFTSSTSKRRAEQAYDFLAQQMSSGYGPAAREQLSQLSFIAQLPQADAWADFAKNSVYFFNTLEQIRPGLLGTDDTLYGLPEELAEAIQQEPFYPEGLNCQLRRYQEWGVKYVLHQKKVLLGDEMGLGKTIQAIAAMVSLQNSGATHFMVVCPASVVENWCREVQKHSNLSVIKIHGSGREAALQFWLERGGVAITTYETTIAFQLADAFRFTMLVVDEAHYIKNPKAQRTQAVTALCLHAERMLFMTGTALENRVEEMISLISILQPQVAHTLQSMASLSAAPQFREAVVPVYYRRKREDVLTELPDLIETEEWCTLTREERQIYEQAILSEQFAQARRVSWNIPDPTRSSKGQRLLELVEEAAEEGRKVLVFSFFLDTIAKVRQLLGARCLPPINGSLPPHERQALVDQFEQAPAGTVLLAQIQAGGTGLNIQSASVVLLCEPQFKPSIENQAISRAYRMGQTRNVLVYRLLCEDTVDEEIVSLLAEKQKAFDAFADESMAAASTLELDQKTFGTIMQQEKQRIQQNAAP